MPMIKKRRKMDKKKRRCLFGAAKKTKLDPPIENLIILEKPIIKKHKNGRLLDIKKEESELIKESNSKLNSDSNLKSSNNSIEDKEIEQSVEQNNVDIKEELLPNSKLSTKNKQWYVNIDMYVIPLIIE